MIPKLVLLALSVTSVYGTASHDGIFGVHPSRQHLYEPTIDNTGKKTWKCLSDPSIVLTYDQINDNYCDCPDGSDEPGTNACPYNAEQKFYCANVGHIPAYIDNFKLNDGVCDYDICCDGSDEYLTGLCPDKCKEISEQFQHYKDKATKEVEKSLSVKQDYADKARAHKEKVIVKLESAQKEIQEKEAQVQKLKVQFRDEQIKAQFIADNPENEDKSIYDEVSPLIDQLVNSLESHTKSKNSWKLNIKKLEDLLSHLVENYNPNFNDLAVKQTINNFQEYLSNIEEDSEKDSEYSPSTILSKLSNKLRETGKKSVQNLKNVEEYIPPTFSNMINHYYTILFPQKSEEIPDDKVVDFEDYRKSAKAAKLEKEIESIEKEISALQSEAAIYQENLEINFGENDLLRSVTGSWVNKNLGEYNYKIGFMDAIYQENILIGRFDSYENGQLKYLRGNKCWNGPHRSGTVDLVCGPRNELVSVSEPEKCEYQFLVRSPIACKDLTDEFLLQNFKVDLNTL